MLIVRRGSLWKRRSSSARHRGRHVRPRRWGLRVWVAGGLSVLLVAGAVMVATLTLNGNIRRFDLETRLGARPSRAVMDAHPLNILVMGSDTREGSGNSTFGRSTVEGGAHSDTNLLVHISADRSWATVVSIPRDSMTKAPADCADPQASVAQGVIRQWNYNFHNGGPACTVRALEGLTGLYVDHAVVLDFQGFQSMVDALGGVSVCLSQPLKDRSAHIDLPAGRQTLNGRQALGYVRARKSLGDGSDLGRIKRQQAFMASIVQEATRSSLLLQPNRLYGFLDAATSALTVDAGFGLPEIRDLLSSLQGIGLHNVRFLTVPTRPYPADPNRVEWSPTAGDLWADLRVDRRWEAERPRPPGSASSKSARAGGGQSTGPTSGVPQRAAEADICSPDDSTEAPVGR